MTISRTERLMDMGFFPSEEALHLYAQELKDLEADETRFDLKWKYGIDQDVMDGDIKLVEVRNWIKRLASSPAP
jgi:GMP synthase (glutamine-hydrolysing)